MGTSKKRSATPSARNRSASPPRAEQRPVRKARLEAEKLLAPPSRHAQPARRNAPRSARSGSRKSGDDEVEADEEEEEEEASAENESEPGSVEDEVEEDEISTESKGEDDEEAEDEDESVENEVSDEEDEDEKESASISEESSSANDDDQDDMELEEEEEGSVVDEDGSEESEDSFEEENVDEEVEYDESSDKDDDDTSGDGEEDEDEEDEDEATESDSDDRKRAKRQRQSSGKQTTSSSRQQSRKFPSRAVSNGQKRSGDDQKKAKSKSSSTSGGNGKSKGGLDVGSEVFCKWSGNNEEYPARILKTRTKGSHAEGGHEHKGPSEKGDEEFYVRYLGFDHRLDEWVPRQRIREAPPGSFNSASYASISAAQSPSPSHASGDEGEVHQVKNIHSIELGKYEIETWYYSPYPEEYAKANKLFLCEYCLKYMKKRHTLERHAEKCEARHPPGREIYRENELSVFEVDGKKQRIYCQNLCLLSKLFLDHKTLYYDVDPFYFYVLTECDDEGAHIVGYFSKEKYSPDGYNLACIMTLPPYQRKGYGSFLISLSYELSKREGVVGSPEKPLSDLGRLGYRSYWSRVVLGLLREYKGKDLSISDIAKMTAICTDDIVDTLKELKLVRYWKGKHVLVVSQKLIDAYLNSTSGKRFRVIEPANLVWTPKRSGRVGSGEKQQRS